MIRALSAALRRRARAAFGVRTAKCDAVTFVQRFGGALNLNVHFHTLALDGVYEVLPGAAGIRFRPLPPPDTQEVLRVLADTTARVLRGLTRRGLGEDSAEEDPLAKRNPVLAAIYAAALQGRAALGEDAGRPLMRIGLEAVGPGWAALSALRASPGSIPAASWRRLGERLFGRGGTQGRWQSVRRGVYSGASTRRFRMRAKAGAVGRLVVAAVALSPVAVSAKATRTFEIDVRAFCHPAAPGAGLCARPGWAGYSSQDAMKQAYEARFLELSEVYRPAGLSFRLGQLFYAEDQYFSEIKSPGKVFPSPDTDFTRIAQLKTFAASPSNQGRITLFVLPDLSIC